jgi:hypothetical protein
MGQRRKAASNDGIIIHQETPSEKNDNQANIEELKKLLRKIGFTSIKITLHVGDKEYFLNIPIIELMKAEMSGKTPASLWLEGDRFGVEFNGEKEQVLQGQK